MSVWGVRYIYPDLNTARCTCILSITWYVINMYNNLNGSVMHISILEHYLQLFPIFLLYFFTCWILFICWRIKQSNFLKVLSYYVFKRKKRWEGQREERQGERKISSLELYMNHMESHLLILIWELKNWKIKI